MSGAGVRVRVRGLGTAIQAIGWVIFLGSIPLLYIVLRSAGTYDLWNPKLWDLLGGIGMLTAGGAGLALWRRGLTVDESAGTVMQWWGFGFPIGRKVYRRDAIACVGLAKEVLNTSKGPRVEYWVRLVPLHGEYPPLGRYIFWDHARRDAEAYAKLLRSDLRDESSGQTVVRDAAHLDESLRQRHRRLGIAAPFPAQPQGAVARLRYGGAGGSCVIEIPATGLRAAHFGPLLALPAIVALALVVVHFADDGSVSWLFVVTLLSLIFALPMLMLLTNLVSAATRRETITFSASGVEIALRGLVGRSTQTVRAEDIEEIAAPAPPAGFTDAADRSAQVGGFQHPSTMVMLRTDRGDVGVGRSLPFSERAWLRDMLVHAIAGHATAPGTVFPREPATAFGAPMSLQAPYAAAPDAARGHTKWLLALAGVLALVAYLSGIPRKPAPEGPGSAGPGARELPGFELTPGPGSGYIRIYGRGVRAEADGGDLRIVIDEVRLVATEPRAGTAHRSLALSVHRKVDGDWRLVGHAEHKGPESEIDPGGTYAYRGAQVFVIAGGATLCRREACHFRLHVLGRVGSNRPGWDVTDMAPLRLP